MNSPHKGQWRGALIFSLIYDWINGWVNKREAGDLRHHRAHYAATVMLCTLPSIIDFCCHVPQHQTKKSLKLVPLLDWCLDAWWCHQMETFSVLLALCVGNSPGTGEFPSQRPVTWSFEVFFGLRLNEWLSKQSWGWWFEMPLHSLWCHCNESNCCFHFYLLSLSLLSLPDLYYYFLSSLLFLFLLSLMLHFTFTSYCANCHIFQAPIPIDCVSATSLYCCWNFITHDLLGVILCCYWTVYLAMNMKCKLTFMLIISETHWYPKQVNVWMIVTAKLNN